MSARPHPRHAAPIAALVVALVVALATIVAACSGSGAGASGGSAGVAMRIDDAWIRVPMAPTGPAGAFMTIANVGDQPDTLLGVSSPAATAVEVHETTTAADGSMGMHPIDRLDIPAGGSVELKSGSYHVMLIGLTKELKAGDTVELTLTFEKAGPVTVTAEVRAG